MLKLKTPFSIWARALISSKASRVSNNTNVNFWVIFKSYYVLFWMNTFERSEKIDKISYLLLILV